MLNGNSEIYDALAVADFLDQHVEFLPEKQRGTYLAALKILEEETLHATRFTHHKKAPAELAMNLGAATWPMRRALAVYLSGEGVEEEWKTMLETVRPTTALLLKRLRKNTNAKSLDEVLASSDAAYAIHDREEEEINHVRPEARLQIWKARASFLAPMVESAKKEFTEMQKRFQAFRKLAVASKAEERALLDKVQRYEERAYIGGEMFSLEMLDEELLLDRGDAEIPVMEGTM